MKNCRIWGVIFVFAIMLIIAGCGNSPLSTVNSTTMPQTKENLTLIFLYDPTDPIKKYDIIKNLTVTITNASNPSIYYDMSSDSDGRCDFIGITKGEYRLAIHDESWTRVSTCYIDHHQIKTEIKVDFFTTTPYDDPEYGVYLKKTDF